MEATAEPMVKLDKKAGVYDRQKELKLKVPKSVAVIGLGGVGSHVALDFALDGAEKVLMIDYDTVEESNRNRTMYTSLHVGIPKVEAMYELIQERRRTEAIPIIERVENLDPAIFEGYDLVVDCRDNSNPLPEEIMKKIKIIGGYNGHEITIHINPSGTKVWGEGVSSYTITPSWSAPPQLISIIIRNYLLTARARKKEYIKHFNIKTLINSMLELKKEDE